MAARSVRVNFRNSTGATLTKLGDGLVHGVWHTRPPETIESSATWESESSGVATGTEGFASYTIAGAGTVTVRWNNPFFGKNSYGAQSTNGFIAETAGGAGDNAVVDAKLERSGVEIVKRPFYAVAHRVNGLDNIQNALSAGANAVECDVRENVVDHDGTFAWSTKLDEWLDRAAQASAQFPDFALIYFDIKEPAVADQIAERARARLPQDLNLLFSIANYADREALRSLSGSLRQREGVAIDEHDDPNEVAAFFRDVGVMRCWYGNGIFVAGPPGEIPVIEGSIRAAVSNRDSGGVLKKVAVWTLARRDSMAEYVKVGVDAILVNEPDLGALRAVVAESRYVRVATRADSAF